MVCNLLGVSDVSDVVKKVRGGSDFQSGSRVNFFSKERFAHFEGMMCDGFALSLQMSKRLIHMLDGTM